MLVEGWVLTYPSFIHVRRREIVRLSVMAWIIVGIIAGWLAKRVIPCEGPRSIPGIW